MSTVEQARAELTAAQERYNAAWNAWRAKRKVSQIRVYANGELIPCPEPK